MYIARILSPVINVLGPGKRIGIWVSGCTRGCPGCSNPELWQKKPGQQISIERLSQLLHQCAQAQPVDGITITGGEPLDQWDDLLLLLDAVRDITRDVLIYTGYTLGDLPEEKRSMLSENAAVVIDGEYVEALNTAAPLRGSSNQRIHFLRPEVMPAYDECQRSAACRTQNFTINGNSLVSVGIHRPDYAEDLPRMAAEKGLIPHDD